MTYLNLINAVLRRLRENEVSSYNQTSYSALIGDFVNDARQLVADSWDWTELRQRLTITTSASDDTYSLTGAAHNGEVLNIWNDTSNLELSYQTNEWFDRQNLIGNPASGTPRYYTYADGLDGNGDIQVKLYPVPDNAYTLEADVVIRDNELASNADVLAIPEKPVIHLALALARDERGEDGGTSGGNSFQIANKFLSDAIAIDASRHPEDTIWYTP